MMYCLLCFILSLSWEPASPRSIRARASRPLSSLRLRSSKSPTLWWRRFVPCGTWSGNSSSCFFSSQTMPTLSKLIKGDRGSRRGSLSRCPNTIAHEQSTPRRVDYRLEREFTNLSVRALIHSKQRELDAVVGPRDNSNFCYHWTWNWETSPSTLAVRREFVKSQAFPTQQMKQHC